MIQRNGGGGATVGFSYRILACRDGRHGERVSDGSPVWMSYEVAPVAVDWSGDTMRVMVGRARENTERLQAALLNSISHELRTPLVSITGALSTLADAPESLEGRETTAWHEMVDTAYEEAQRLNLLVGNLLDMTRLEGGTFHLNLEPGDIQDLVGIALARFAQRHSSHAVLVDLPETLPLVSMDMTLMTQVVLNLLDNAAKYSPEEAPIEIQGKQTGNEVVLSILDQGIGIPETDLPKVFDKFYRTPLTRSISGIGLGLSISKGIVEAHGGHIWAENRPAGGSVISLAMPVEQAGEASK